MEYGFSSEVIKILDELAQRLGIVIDWTSENVMPYLMELYERFITYKIVINCIPIVLLIVFIVAFVIYLNKYFKCKELVRKTKENNLFFNIHQYLHNTEIYKETGFCEALRFALVVGTVIFSLTCILYAIPNLLQLIFIPELYMLDYLSNYIG